VKVYAVKLSSVSVAALIAAASFPALAEGTSAGSSITNTATVDYQIDGVSQTQETGSDTFI